MEKDVLVVTKDFFTCFTYKIIDFRKSVFIYLGIYCVNLQLENSMIKSIWTKFLVKLPVSNLNQQYFQHP